MGGGVDFYVLIQQGAKKFFTACHLSKLKLTYHLLAQTSFQLAPKTFWWAELIWQFCCNLNSSKNFTCTSGKLRTEFTSPMAKYTSPGLSDTTFFARPVQVSISSIPSVASYMRKRHVLIFGCKHDMFCCLTFEVCSKRMLSTCFVFAQQYIISGGKCAVSEPEICPKVEKNEIWAECTDQKLINNLSLAWQFCLNGCQASNIWRQNT